MRLLLDTHAFLWWVGASPRLSRRAKAAIASARNQCLVSIASAWEIAIKVSLGRLRIDAPLDRFLPEQLAVNGFAPLAIDIKHTALLARLPFHHRDPFDRLLVAQAMDEELAVVTADPVFGRYGVKRVW
jgi:PIN domain nuclease of toxin-antitoxin system